MVRDKDSREGGITVSGYGHEDTGTMAEYLDRELARRQRTGESRPVPPKMTKQAAKKAAAVSTDYPWLRADWVEPKVDPLKLRNRRKSELPRA